MLRDYTPGRRSAGPGAPVRFGERVGYRIADMAQPGWAGPSTRVYPLAIHNLDSPALIQLVYRDVFPCCCGGGM